MAQITLNSSGVASDGALALQSNGTTTAVTIDTSQKVGIGTASPATTLHLRSAVCNVRLEDADTSAYANVGVDNSGSMYLQADPANSQASSTMYFSVDGTERMRIDSSGNVGIGTSSPTAKLDTVFSNGGVGPRFRNTTALATNEYSQVVLSVGTAEPFTAGANNRTYQVQNICTSATASDFKIQYYNGSTDTYSERMRIDSSGNFIVTNGGGNNRIYSTGVYNVTNASAANMIVTSDGGFARSTSSLKYKQNVNDSVRGLSDLLKLRAVTYESKNESEAGIVFGGLIAEEVHEAGLTEFVQYAEDGSPDALAYGNMVSLCVNAIKEQQAIITALQADVAALKGTA
jgi:hypothetical protein